MSKLKNVLYVVLLAVFLTCLSGCEREGPMERAGKKIDKAVEDTTRAIKDAGKKKEEKKE